MSELMRNYLITCLLFFFVMALALYMETYLIALFVGIVFGTSSGWTLVEWLRNRASK